VKLFFDENNISYNISDWDIYLPCNYNNAKYEISKIPIRKNSKYFIIDNLDQISSKNKLSINIKNYYNNGKINKLIPKTFILNNKSDINELKKNHNPTKIYILKKNKQRQTGLKIEKDIKTIIENKDNYIIAQELLRNSILINGRKINLRVYFLVVCKQNIKTLYVYNNGFMYYSKELYDDNSLSPDVHITTGYIDREIYKKNPLTLFDFKKYMDKTYKNHNIFNKINLLLKNIFLSFRMKICRPCSKLYPVTSYQLFGADIHITNSLDPILIEINKGPDLIPKDKIDREVKIKLANDIHEIIGIIKYNNNNGFTKII